jgi:syntaxin 1B/2/3
MSAGYGSGQYSSNPYGGGAGGGGQQQQGGYGGSYGSGGGYGQDDQYGGNGGYGGQQGGYGQSDRYNAQQQQPAGGYGGGAGYGQSTQQPTTQQSSYGQGPTVLKNPEFLTRVEAVRKDIDTLTSNISSIASLHQRAISATDSSSSAALESLVASTQVLNTHIKDQIKFLETDAARSGGNATKDSQVRNLKNQFKTRLEQYQQEEVLYKKRYQEQIARQYRIVNPAASEEEVREAVQADWGDEGVFQTAVCFIFSIIIFIQFLIFYEQLKSNRTGHATSVLGSVRARHNDIQRIEKTLIELHQLFQDLAEQVEIQDTMVQQTEQQTDNVKTDTEAANVQLTKGIASARRARKLKWCLFITILLIIIIVGLAVGLYFGVGPGKPAPKNNSG